MWINRIFLLHFCATIFSVKSEDPWYWENPPWTLTQDAIDKNVVLEDGTKLVIPEDLPAQTPILNLNYNSGTVSFYIEEFLHSA